MTRKEWQIFSFIERFKHHIQDYLLFKPTALSNFHHFSDRLLDKRDGSFELFRKNIKEMVKDSDPINEHGAEILDKLGMFVEKGKSFIDFQNVVYWIYEGNLIK